MAVRPSIIFALTFKAGNLNNTLSAQTLLLRSSVCSHQKQGLMLEALVSEQPEPHYPMYSVQWSTAQLE